MVLIKFDKSFLLTLFIKVVILKYMQTSFELKKHNTVKIFRALQRHERASRKELSKITGLSWGSVSAITNELLSKNIIVADKEASAGGRPAETLSLHPTHFLQLGIDVNSVGLTFAIVNMRGKAIFAETLVLESHKKEYVVDTLLTQTEKILAQTENVIGISLSMQGKINRKTGISIRASFENWQNVPLVELFEKRFSLPTTLYHDPDCLLYYHLYNDEQLRDKKDGYVIRLDNGIGMARLLHGKLYNVGDVGSYEFDQIIAVPNGRACSYGNAGCLDAYASLRSMREIYAEQTGDEQSDFTQKLREHEETAWNVLRVGTTYLGIAIANLFTLSAPEFVLLDGALLTIVPHCFTEIDKSVREHSNDSYNLLCANYKKEAPAIGACLITLENNTEELLFDL